MPTTRYALPLLLLALFLPGCAQPKSAETIPNPMPTTVTDRDLLRRNIDDILQQMNFEVETPPRSPDRIDTLPLVDAYPLEFWRADGTTRDDVVENAFFTVRRTVTIIFHTPDHPPAASGTPSPAPAATPPSPAESSSSAPAVEPAGSQTTAAPDQPAPAEQSKPVPMTIEVIVRKERVDVQQPFTASDTDEMFGIFQQRTNALAVYEDKWGTNIRWIDYGRDAAREQYLLQKIRRRF